MVLYQRLRAELARDSTDCPCRCLPHNQARKGTVHSVRAIRMYDDDDHDGDDNADDADAYVWR